jgi:hypothetical protein
MTDVKVNIYTGAGSHVGYFINPKIDCFPEGDYEITGHFFEPSGQLAEKLDFNPQSIPYTADLPEGKGTSQIKLVNVYVQRGRQPVRVSASKN